MSRPRRSTRKNGPIGATFWAPTASSIFLIESPCSSCARQISPTAELRIRLTTKPGTSSQTIGCLRIVWAKLTAASIVSSSVTPATISTSGMTDAG